MQKTSSAPSIAVVGSLCPCGTVWIYPGPMNPTAPLAVMPSSLPRTRPSCAWRACPAQPCSHCRHWRGVIGCSVAYHLAHAGPRRRFTRTRSHHLGHHLARRRSHGLLLPRRPRPRPSYASTPAISTAPRSRDRPGHRLSSLWLHRGSPPTATALKSIAASPPSTATAVSTCKRSAPARSPPCSRSPTSATSRLALRPRRRARRSRRCHPRARQGRQACGARRSFEACPRSPSCRAAAASPASAPRTATSAASSSSTAPAPGPVSSASWAGVPIPLQAAEHYYQSPTSSPACTPASPSSKTLRPTATTARKAAAMIGLFEPVCAPGRSRAFPKTFRSARSPRLGSHGPVSRKGHAARAHLAGHRRAQVLLRA